MTRTHTIRTRAVPGTVLSLLLAASAFATDKVWHGPTDGNASDALRWTPSGRPGSADDIFFNVPSLSDEFYTVTFDGLVAQSNAMRIASAGVRLDMSAEHTTGLFNVQSGKYPPLGNTYDTTCWLENGVLRTTLFQVGLGGTAGDTARLIIDGPAYLYSTNDSYVGRVSGSNVYVGDMQVLGRGTVRIGESGGATRHLWIAREQGAIGSVTVENYSTPGFGSSLEVYGTLHIGHNTAPSPGGNATLNIRDHGYVRTGSATAEFLGEVYVGDPNSNPGGPFATLRLQGGELSTRMLTVLANTNGVFDFQHGFVQVRGQSATVRGYLSLEGAGLTLNGMGGVSGLVLFDAIAILGSLTLGTMGDSAPAEINAVNSSWVQVDGNADVGPAGTLAVGAGGGGRGWTSIGGTYTNTGELRVTLQNDMLAGPAVDVEVDANLGGSLTVALDRYYFPSPDSTFVLVECDGTLAGEFAGVSLPSTDWQLIYNRDTTPRQVLLHFTGRCVADVDDGSGTGTPDGGVTIDDLLYYLYIFELGDIAADVDDGSGTGTKDGGVTIDDLLYFLIRFEAGC